MVTLSRTYHIPNRSHFTNINIISLISWIIVCSYCDIWDNRSTSFYWIFWDYESKTYVSSRLSIKKRLAMQLNCRFQRDFGSCTRTITIFDAFSNYIQWANEVIHLLTMGVKVNAKRFIYIQWWSIWMSIEH